MARLNNVPEPRQPQQVERRSKRLGARPTRQESKQPSEKPNEDQSEDQNEDQSDHQSDQQTEEPHEPRSEAATNVEEIYLSSIIQSSKHTRNSLITEPQSMVELKAVCNSTDLEEFLATSDLKQALVLGQKIIIGRSQLAEAVNLQCAIDISVVWKVVDKLNSTHPNQLSTITKWQGDIARQLQSQNDGRDIDYYLGLAKKTLMRLSQYNKRIFDKWGVLPTQILSKDRYSEKRPLSKGTLQAMAKLADLTSREQGQKTLTDIIEKRSNIDTRSSYESHEPYLLPADIMAAIAVEKDRKHNEIESDADEKDRKRDHDEIESGAEFKSLTSPPRMTKRPKRKYNTSRQAKKKDNEDDEQHSQLETAPSPSCSFRSTVDDQDKRDSTNAAGISQPSTPTRPGPTTPEMSPISIELPRKAPMPMSDFQSPDLPDLQLDSIASSPLSSLGTSQDGRKISPPASPPRRDTNRPIFVDNESPDPKSEQLATDQGTVLATLNPGSKLSSTVVHDSMKFFLPEDCHLIDPLFFNSTFPERTSLRRPLASNVNRIFMPLHNAQLVHWTLVVITFKDTSICVYDSLAPKSIDGVLAKRLRDFAQGIAPGSQVWTVQLAVCPKQSNGYDCGIHVIADAVFLMTKTGLPHHHDCDAWRLVCRALLGDRTEDPRLDDLPQFSLPEGGEGHQEAVKNSLLHTDEDALAVALRSTGQFAQRYLSNIQAQMEKLKAVHESAVAMMKVIEDVHRQRNLKAYFMNEQLLKYEEHYAEHEALIEKYSKLADDFLGQDVLSNMRSSIRSTQAAVKNQLDEKAKRKQSAYASMLKSKALVEVARQITKRYNDQLSVLETGKWEHLQMARTWREMTADAMRKFDQVVEAQEKGDGLS